MKTIKIKNIRSVYERCLLQNKVEKIIVAINKEMPITAEDDVKKDIDRCYRRILTNILG